MRRHGLAGPATDVRRIGRCRRAPRVARDGSRGTRNPDSFQLTPLPRVRCALCLSAHAICDCGNGAGARISLVWGSRATLVLQKMAAPKDKDVDQPEATGVQPAGRVEFDSRGNSVWRWAKDVIDSTSILLKRLENKDLAIEPTQKVPVIGGNRLDGAARTPSRNDPSKVDKRSSRRAELGLAEQGGGRDSGGGFNPYDRRR